MDDVIVFDIETQKSFDEVGGRRNLHLLGISVLAAYSYNREKTFVFEEKNLSQFKKMLENCGLLVGFNSEGFDIPILQSYGFDLSRVPSLDLMKDIKTGAGFRISLDNIAGATIGTKKSASGLLALQWYKEGKIEEIKKYCVKDVLITKQVYDFGKSNNFVFFINREKEKIAIPVYWAKEKQKEIREILEEAYKLRKRVEIEYITGRQSADGLNGVKNVRLIDIYGIRHGIVEGYCHLRKEKRMFKADRIISARISAETYKIKEDAQDSLFF